MREVQAWVDGKPAEVQYAGAAPGAVAGLFQVNVRIPLDAASGDVPIEIHVGTAQHAGGHDGFGEVRKNAPSVAARMGSRDSGYRGRPGVE